MKIIILIVAGVVVVLIIIEVLGRLLYAFIFTTCQLNKSLFFRDRCKGTCPPGQACVATGTKPYFWGGVQDNGCTCGPAGSGVPGGTGGPGGPPAGAPPGPGGGGGSGGGG